MSPSSWRKINGPRPSSLKIDRASYQIHKPSSSSSTNRNHHPVIIYAQSPKVIHTQPRDFMALVQKLTGFHPGSQPPMHATAPAANVNNTAAGVVAAELGSVEDCTFLGSTYLFCLPRDFYVGGSMLPSFVEDGKTFQEF